MPSGCLTRRYEVVGGVEVVQQGLDGDGADEPFGAAVVEVVGGDVDAD